MGNVQAVQMDSLVKGVPTVGKKNASGENAFQTLMQGSAGQKKTMGDHQPQIGSKLRVDRTGSGRMDIQNEDTVSAQNQDVTQPAQKEMGSISTTANREAISETKDVLTEKTEAVESAICDIVKDELGLDDQTMETILSQMGISAIQLLDPSVLKQFVIQANDGSDITELLTSETMFTNYTNIMTDLQNLDLDTQFQLSPQDIDTFLQNLEMASQQSSEIISDKMESMQQAEVSIEEHGEMEQVSSVITNASSIAMEKTIHTNVADTDMESMENVAVSTDVNEATEVNAQTSQQDFSGENSQMLFRDSSSQTMDRKNTSDVAQQTQPVTMMNFVDNMMQAVSGEQPVSTVQMQQMIEIVNQVVEQIRSNMQDGATTMEMQLNPENLGKVFLSVTSKEGVMTATFTVQSAEAKEALESQMITLRESLEQKNLKVESVEVSVSDFDFMRQGQEEDAKNFQQGNGKRRNFQFDQENEEEISKIESDKIRKDVMRDNGSSVDYTA